MPRYNGEVRIVLSLLDRLIDYEPELQQEPLLSRTKGLKQLKQAVRRDMEWLLNTRQTPEEFSAELREVNRSVATYGLPDFTTLNIKNSDDQDHIRGLIEEEISIFEPRLEGVSVSLDPVAGNQEAMCFRIEARLRVDPAPEPVTFDTLLDLGTAQYRVREK
jgi:type VI secretion system protein ImpF